MKKGIVLVVLVVFLLFSSCIQLEEVPTTTPTTVVSTQTAVQIATEEIPTHTAAPTVPTATEEIISTETIEPGLTSTETVEPSLTPTSLPSATPTQLPFAIQADTPVYTENFAHPDAECNWLGVGGQIFDSNGEPIINLVIWIRGSIDEKPFEAIALTGTAEGAKYGPGGYEAVLNTSALETSDVFSIQVLDLNGNILTEPYFFDTFEQCDQNLIVINFVRK